MKENFMDCVNHPQREATGACVYCGKMYCAECLVEISGRMYCKKDVSKVVEETKAQSQQPQSNNASTPNVIVNNSTSSFAMANASIGGRHRRMHWIYFFFIGWWLGIFSICCIIPIFIPGLVARAFGYW
jgi:hypothetical protein